MGEQVTIVRIAIEEILEKAIDPRFRCPCVYVSACEYMHVYKSRVCADTCAGRSRTTATGLLVETTPCSKQHCELTLDISEVGHARTRCLPMVSPATSKY